MRASRLSCLAVLLTTTLASAQPRRTPSRTPRGTAASSSTASNGTPTAAGATGGCPDPSSLYGLRTLDEAGLRRLLRLRPAPPVRDDERFADPMRTISRRWDIRVLFVRPPTADRCHDAVVRAVLREYVSDERSHTSTVTQLAFHLVTVTLASTPRGVTRVLGPALDPDDPLGRIDALSPDVDADGHPDPIEIAYVARAQRLRPPGRRDVAYVQCGLPETRVLRFALAGRRVEVPISGAIESEETVAETQAALASSAECASIRPRWFYDDPRGEPIIRARPDGVDVDVVVARRTCEGMPTPYWAHDVCTEPSLVHVHHETRGASLTTRTSPAAASIVRVDADASWLVAVPFSLFDGDASPHVIAAAIEPDEGRRSSPQTRLAASGREGVALFPGTHLVEVWRDERRLTYQVVIGIGDAPRSLAPP